MRLPIALLVATLPVGAAAGVNELYVNALTAPMHQQADAGSPVISELRLGQAVELLGWQAEWAHVRERRQPPVEGWVLAELLGSFLPHAGIALQFFDYMPATDVARRLRFAEVAGRLAPTHAGAAARLARARKDAADPGAGEAALLAKGLEDSVLPCPCVVVVSAGEAAAAPGGPRVRSVAVGDVFTRAGAAVRGYVPVEVGGDVLFVSAEAVIASEALIFELQDTAVPGLQIMRLGTPEFLAAARKNPSASMRRRLMSLLVTPNPTSEAFRLPSGDMKALFRYFKKDPDPATRELAEHGLLNPSELSERARGDNYAQASVVNVRSAPDAAAPVVARVPIYDPLFVLEAKGDWARVATAAASGFAQLQLIGPQPPRLVDLLSAFDALAPSDPERRSLAERAAALAPTDLRALDRLAAALEAAGDTAALARVRRAIAELGCRAGEWREVVPAGPKPPARQDFAAVLLGDRLLVFGGKGSSGPQDDLWELSLADGKQAWRRLAPAGTPPSARAGASLVHDAEHDQVILFGGMAKPIRSADVAQPGPQLFNDVHALSLKALEWRALSTSGARPPGGAYNAVVDGSGRLVVFGLRPPGERSTYDPPPPPNYDVWALPLGKLEWSRLYTSGIPPTAEPTQPSAWDAAAGRVIAFSGLHSRDVWSLELAPAGATWSHLPTRGDLPPLPIDYITKEPILWSAAFDAKNRAAIYLVPWQGMPSLKALVVSDSGTSVWRPIVTPNAPGQRDAYVALYDPKRHGLWVVGSWLTTPPHASLTDVWWLPLGSCGS